MGNKIPRNFNKIVCEQLTVSNSGEIGDIYHVYKNNFGYQLLNKRTELLGLSTCAGR